MGDMTQGKQAEVKALARRLMSDAALQQAMSQEISRVNEASVYAVADEWLRTELRKLEMLRQARTGSELEALVRDAGTRAVYIPQDSALNLTLVCDILRRTAANVPVFMERAA